MDKDSNPASLSAGKSSRTCARATCRPTKTVMMMRTAAIEMVTPELDGVSRRDTIAEFGLSACSVQGPAGVRRRGAILCLIMSPTCSPVSTLRAKKIDEQDTGHLQEPSSVASWRANEPLSAVDGLTNWLLTQRSLRQRLKHVVHMSLWTCETDCV
jgi:hypothetical protein